MTTPPTNFLRQHQAIAPGGAPLSAEQLTSLQQAADAYRQLRKCAAVANFSGITTVALGVLGIGCLATGVNATSILAVVVMITVGVVELVGRQRILRGDVGAPKFLAMNQLAFIAAITLYCCVQMLTFNAKSYLNEAGKDFSDAGVNIRDMLPGNIEQTGQRVIYGFYSLVMLISWASQGRLALYYWRRKGAVDAYNATPEWQRQLMRNVST